MVYGYFKRGSYDCATIYRFMDIHSPFFGRFAIDITIQGMNRNDRIPDSFKTLNEAESYLKSAGFVKVD